MSLLVRQNPLWDRAETHTFSDWLIPYVLHIGVEDLDEFYLGGFPDLSSILERDETSFRLNPLALKEAIRGHITPFGKMLSRKIKNSVFIDLGCGIPEKSVVPRLLAQAFQAKFYVGVDSLHLRSDEIRQHEILALGGFTSYFLKEDLLKFCSQLEMHLPKVIFLAGIEAKDETSDTSKIYFEKLTRELKRIVEVGDILILGAGSPVLNMGEDFHEIYSDYYHSVLERKRKFFGLF